MADSLVRFGQPAVPVLTGLLEHPSDDVRWTATYAHCEIGPGAKGATDAICKMLQDKDEEVGALAVRALVAIGAESEFVVPLFIESLKSKSGVVRLAAAEGLGHFGSKAREAVPLLVKVFNANDIDVGGSQWAIGEALKRIDPEAARQAIK